MIKEEQKKIICELRHELHRHPDLSGEEGATMEILCSFLREHTSLEIVRREGWFYAVRQGKKGTPMAFRADMDALPIPETIPLPYASEKEGISHKCGHDGHMAALCALALLLEEDDLPEEERRTIYLIFQPAEEIGAGARVCAGLIREKGIGEIYAFHNLGGYPEGALVYRRGLTQPASEGLRILLSGKSSHASYPEEGRNPAWAIARLALLAGELGRGPVKPAGAGETGCSPAAPPQTDGNGRGMRLVTITGMEAGTGDFGISAGEGSLSVTLRAEEESDMKEMEEALLSAARKEAEAGGFRMEYEVRDYFPETRNHDGALDKVLCCAEDAGIPAVEMERLWRASEDFGWYLKECPGAIFYIGNGEDYPPLHTVEYDFNDRILETAAGVFRRLAIKQN